MDSTMAAPRQRPPRAVYRRTQPLCALWLCWRRFALRISSSHEDLHQPGALLSCKTPRQGRHSAISESAWSAAGIERTSPSPLPSPTSPPSPAVVRAVGERAVCAAAATPVVAPGQRIAGDDQRREAHDTPAFERTESALSSAGTPNAHDAPDWDRRTCKYTYVGRAVREEPVEAGVRARMCASSDSFAADKSLAVVANVERSAGPHHGRLVLRREDRSGDIIASLSLMPESLQLAQVSDQVVEMLPLAPGQSRSTVPVVYLAFKNSARFERFRRMVGSTACPLV
jgi:hypothetical protein